MLLTVKYQQIKDISETENLMTGSFSIRVSTFRQTNIEWNVFQVSVIWTRVGVLCDLSHCSQVDKKITRSF